MKLGLFLGGAAVLVTAATVAQSPESPSFKRDIVPLFSAKCAFCHMKEGPDAGLILEPRFSYLMIVGVPSTESSLARVEPGHPERSYLLLKMQNRQREAGGSGNKMPVSPGGVGFGNLSATPSEIELVRAWIAAGAPDN